MPLEASRGVAASPYNKVTGCVPNDNSPICRSKLVGEMFEHSTLLTNQSKFTKVPKVVKLFNE